MQEFLTKHGFRKVPEITLIFWIIKLLTTAMGESTSDYLVHTIDPVIAVLVGGVGLVIALFLQFLVKKYIPWVYWLAVTMVAIFGTMFADVLHIGLGIPYIVSTILFIVLLTIVFTTWYVTEKTLSIHSIFTMRREVFYWATVIVAFALGTAAGDMTAATFRWGYLVSGIVFAVLFIFPLLGQKLLKWNEIITFWFAYIMTRPFGASFADYLGRSSALGGIGVGTGVVSIVLGALIVILVGYLTMSHSDVKLAKN